MHKSGRQCIPVRDALRAMDPAGTPPAAQPLADPAPRRPYTMSEAALAQRRAAAQLSTGPKTPEGKAACSRNGWVHGRYSAIHRAAFQGEIANMAKMLGTPCRTTCPVHPDNPDRTEAPCSLVTNQLTRAGGSCLDKSVYVERFDAIMQALQDGNNEALHGVLANEVAQALQLMNQLRAQIFEQGLMISIPAVTREGEVIKDGNGNLVPAKVLAHPALPSIIAMLDVLKINFPELLATPRAANQARREADTGDALQTLLGHAAARLLPVGGGAPAPALPPAGEGLAP